MVTAKLLFSLVFTAIKKGLPPKEASPKHEGAIASPIPGWTLPGTLNVCFTVFAFAGEKTKVYEGMGKTRRSGESGLLS
jgi:hypothetical protein